MGIFDFKPAYDFRGKRFLGPLRGLAGKPIHPPLTDIPVGAYILAPVFDLISFFSSGTTSEALHRSAGYILLAGALVSVVTIASGLADWFHIPQASPAWRLANAHMVTMLTLTLMVVIDLVLRFPAPSGARTGGALAGLGIVILALVILGGALGGALVFGQGARVEAPGEEMRPSSEGD